MSMLEETNEQFTQRLLAKFPLEEHSVRCQLRIENKTWDHWFCECKCHGDKSG